MKSSRRAVNEADRMITVLVWVGYVAGAFFLLFWLIAVVMALRQEEFDDKARAIHGPMMPLLFYGLVLLMMAAFLDHAV